MDISVVSVFGVTSAVRQVVIDHRLRQCALITARNLGAVAGKLTTIQEAW